MGDASVDPAACPSPVPFSTYDTHLVASPASACAPPQVGNSGLWDPLALRHIDGSGCGDGNKVTDDMDQPRGSAGSFGAVPTALAEQVLDGHPASVQQGVPEDPPSRSGDSLQSAAGCDAGGCDSKSDSDLWVDGRAVAQQVAEQPFSLFSMQAPRAGPAISTGVAELALVQPWDPAQLVSACTQHFSPSKVHPAF